ncbi:hypothetical protein [Circoviridae sp.]|nr:hypothetical protein [Circoviridae sp.]
MLAPQGASPDAYAPGSKPSTLLSSGGSSPNNSITSMRRSNCCSASSVLEAHILRG